MCVCLIWEGAEGVCEDTQGSQINKNYVSMLQDKKKQAFVSVCSEGRDLHLSASIQQRLITDTQKQNATNGFWAMTTVSIWEHNESLI